MRSTTPPPSSFNVTLPSGSIAAMVRALPNNHPSTSFRDGAIAILRLSRARGREECDALGLLFEDDVAEERRVLILDLLGSAGTPEAQVVMRRLLSLAVARRESRMFATFVSRLGFVERPDVPTLRYLMGVYAESRHETHEVRAACAYTLGAATGRAHVWGLAEPATRAAEILRQELLVATDANEKCALLAALGNAGLDHDVAIIVRFVTDTDARVRSAAILALRKMHTQEARAVLLAILGSTNSTDLDLAESSLSALFGQSLTEEELLRLSQLVLSGRTALALDSRILRLIVTQKLSVLGGPGGPAIIEDAIHLLLTRVEDQAERVSASMVPPPMEYVLHEEAIDESVDESGMYAKMDDARINAVFALTSPKSSTQRPSLPPNALNLDLHRGSSESSAPSSLSQPPMRSASEALRLCVRKSSRPPPAAAANEEAPAPAPASGKRISSKPPATTMDEETRRKSVYAVAQPIVPLLRIG